MHHTSANIRTLLSKLSTMPLAAYVILAASFASLATALTFQYGLRILPCQLCLWQRVPFVTASVLMLAAALLRPYGRLTWSLFWLCAALFAANAGLAMFHSGVERHWWEWHSSCSGNSLASATSLEDLRQQLLATPVVRCDQIPWSLFGLSMANMNVVFSFALSMFSVAAARCGPASVRVRHNASDSV